MARSKTTAIEERERLREEIARARASRAAHGARVDQLREEAKRIPRARDALLQEAARAGKPANAEELDRRAAELKAEVAAASAAAKAASAATKAAERDLVELHHREFGEFAAAAEELSAEAEAKLAAAEDGYRAAYEAIEAARAEWSLLARDHNRILLDRSSPAERVRGEVKRRQLSPPPSNPLRDPSEVFGTPPIRPPELEPVDEEAA